MTPPPRVYKAIAAITAQLAKRGIAKSRTNVQEHYQFRSIDDLYNRLSPLLARHKLCVLPRILERQEKERNGADGSCLVSVNVKAAFHLVSAEDGSEHVIETFGEALDGGDKATSKAMSAAYKYALLQAFCIPVVGLEDADAQTYRIRGTAGVAEPVQGWEAWVSDISGLARGCESLEALRRVQDTYRAELLSLSKARPELYANLGGAIASRRGQLGLKGHSEKTADQNLLPANEFETKSGNEDRTPSLVASSGKARANGRTKSTTVTHA